MAPISLTTFMDFVQKSGTPKMTVLRQWKNKPEYAPAKDYYKVFRDTVVEMHADDKPIAELNATMKRLKDEKKRANYSELADGYKKWRGRKTIDWFTPTSTLWKYGDFEVSVNPELGLVIDGTPHLIKLYLKATAAKKNQVDLITNLLALTCKKKAPKGCTMGVLDVRRHKLFTPPSPDPMLTAQLEGEAAYWSRVWALM